MIPSITFLQLINKVAFRTVILNEAKDLINCFIRSFASLRMTHIGHVEPKAKHPVPHKILRLHLRMTHIGHVEPKAKHPVPHKILRLHLRMTRGKFLKAPYAVCVIFTFFYAPLASEAYEPSEVYKKMLEDTNRQATQPTQQDRYGLPVAPSYQNRPDNYNPPSPPQKNHRAQKPKAPPAHKPARTIQAEPKNIKPSAIQKEQGEEEYIPPRQSVSHPREKLPRAYEDNDNTYVFPKGNLGKTPRQPIPQDNDSTYVYPRGYKPKNGAEKGGKSYPSDNDANYVYPKSKGRSSSPADDTYGAYPHDNEGDMLDIYPLYMD